MVNFNKKQIILILFLSISMPSALRLYADESTSIDSSHQTDSTIDTLQFLALRTQAYQFYEKEIKNLENEVHMAITKPQDTGFNLILGGIIGLAVGLRSNLSADGIFASSAAGAIFGGIYDLLHHPVLIFESKINNIHYEIDRRLVEKFNCHHVAIDYYKQLYNQEMKPLTRERIARIEKLLRKKQKEYKNS